MGTPKGNSITDSVDINTPSENNWFRIFVKIPYMSPGQSKNIYFCWSPVDDLSLGVPESSNTLDTGRIQQPFDVEENFGNQSKYWQNNKTWDMESAIGPDENSLFTFNFENTEGDTTSLFNKANRANSGLDENANIVASRHEGGGGYNSSTPHVNLFLKSF